MTPPFGLRGGKPGGNAKLSMRLPDGTLQRVPGKGAYTAPAGAVVTIEAPGSGGYGSPSGRDRAALKADLDDGYVTRAAAARDYGVTDPG